MPSLKKIKRESMSSGAGLIRYFDVDEGGPKIDPKTIMGFSAAIIIVKLMLNIILR
jgi:preprotein translocase subunit Sec61beta